MKHKRRWGVLGLILALLLALGLWAGGKGARLWLHLNSLQGTLARLEARANPGALDSLGPADFAALKGDFAALESDLAAVEAEARAFMPLVQHLGWVPWFGGDIQAVPELLDVAKGVAKAGRLALEGAEPLVAAWQQSSSEASGSLLERVLPALVDAGPRLATAQAELEQVAAARVELDVSRLSPRVGALVERLDRYLPLLRQAVQAAALAPSLLGSEDPRSYLVLAQNNHELRAGGGFISAVGLLRLDQGRIEELRFRDSYAVFDPSKPHPASPPALLKYMKADILVFRDANWSPDFPTAAQVMAGLYALDEGEVVDGVIAADLTALQWLVGALEPLHLQGYDETVTGRNVLEIMKAAWEAPAGAGTIAERHDSDWWSHRKDFMGVVLDSMLAKLESGEDVDLGELVRALNRSLNEKHVLIHVDDPQATELLAAAGWDGALRPGDGDFLMVVDSNVGFNKVNPRIEQEMAYQVTLGEGDRSHAELTLRYRHTAAIRLEECIHEARYGDDYDDMMDRCYFDYVRVYVPAGSELREASGFEPGTLESLTGECDTQVFAGFFVLAPGQERVITLSYDLPLDIPSERTYRLRVSKQPGTMALPLSVRVNGRAGAAYETTLAVDREFWVALHDRYDASLP